jgi:hypothetical protein
MMSFFFDPSIIIITKSTETEPPHAEVKEKGLISRGDTIKNNSRQRSLEFIIESVHFIKAYRCVGPFYEFFFLFGDS